MTNIIQKFVVGLAAVSAALCLAPVAGADGYLSPQEERFGDVVSDALCDYLDAAGVSGSSMAEAMKIIYQHTPNNMDMADTVEIINYAVFTYCPRHWGSLVAFGKAMRGQAA